MLLRRTIPWMLVSVVAPACSTVLVERDERRHRDPDVPETNEPETVCEVDPADVVVLRSIETASLIDGLLHLEGQLDGRVTYAIVEPQNAPSGVAELVEIRDDLIGGARWLPQATQFYVRMRGTLLDILDASPRPELVATHEMGAPFATGFETVAYDGGGMYLCLDPPGEAPPEVSRYGTFNPTEPELTETLGLCDLPDSRGVASGRTWVEWSHSTVRIFDLPTRTWLVDHSWETHGAHQYGGLTGIETDSRVIATTLENDAYSFFWLTSPEPSTILYSSLGPGPKKLLGVVANNVVVAVPDGDGVSIVSFALDLPPGHFEPAPQTPMNIVLEGASGDVQAIRALANDEGQMVVSDGDNVFVVPLGAAGTARPLVVARIGSADTCVD